MKESEVKIKVELDENKVPQKLSWISEESSGAWSESKAVLFSTFEKKSLETLKLDLWTKDFTVEEMDRFMFNTIKGLADTYYRATKNNELASAMQQFAQYFGKKTQIIDSSESV